STLSGAAELSTEAAFFVPFFRCRTCACVEAALSRTAVPSPIKASRRIVRGYSGPSRTNRRQLRTKPPLPRRYLPVKQDSSAARLLTAGNVASIPVRKDRFPGPPGPSFRYTGKTPRNGKRPFAPGLLGQTPLNSVAWPGRHEPLATPPRPGANHASAWPAAAFPRLIFDHSDFRSAR